jgi:hypothetical protein
MGVLRLLASSKPAWLADQGHASTRASDAELLAQFLPRRMILQFHVLG